MDSIWLWPLGLVAFLLAWPGLRSLAASLLIRRSRAQALSATPDQILLIRVSEPRWRNLEPRDSTHRQLTGAGFVEAGAYVVREMPELTIALYANSAERAYAVIYDHPRSGLWAEFVTRYEDHSLATYTTLDPVEVDLPDGSVHVSATKLTPADLWKKMLDERPGKPMVPCLPANAAKDFETGCAESVAFHRQHTPVEDAHADGKDGGESDEMKLAA